MSEGAIPQWWYEEHGQKKGPVGAQDIRSMMERGLLGRDSRIIPVGSSQWSTVGQFAFELGLTDLDQGSHGHPPPAPTSSGPSAPTVLSPRDVAPPVIGDLRVASWGIRFGSGFLDLFLAPFTLFVGWILWSILVWPKGLTPAKQILGGLRVIDLETGGPPTRGKMALRELGGKLLLWLASFGISIWVSCLMIVLTESRQAIWDKIANTVVIDDTRSADSAYTWARRRRTGWKMLGVAFFIFTVAAFSSQNATEPDEEQLVIFMLVAAAGFAAVGVAFLLRSIYDRRNPSNT